MVIQNYHFIQEDFWPDIQFYFLVTFVLGYADNLDCVNIALIQLGRASLNPPILVLEVGGTLTFLAGIS